MKLASKIIATGMSVIAFLTTTSYAFADGGPSNPYGSPYGKVHGVVDTALGTVDPLYLIIGALFFIGGFVVVAKSLSLRNKLLEL